MTTSTIIAQEIRRKQEPIIIRAIAMAGIPKNDDENNAARIQQAAAATATGAGEKHCKYPKATTAIDLRNAGKAARAVMLLRGGFV
ncbi:hypothetical protein RRG08_041494 [Elysia crispata]|uniref:Uncharacterized protein n=1 Tax=Elysia crispata TaxID=231223 RepID=A0AAE1CRL8_9GAST|nr:hypothetical protein RRG08_041494 [Elysia crispata]